MIGMSVQDLKKCCDSGQAITIIDLQSPDAYAHRHIPAAVHIDVTEECDEQCARLLRDKDSQLVVYGEFDELGKGKKAVEALAQAGYTNVNRLAGGLMGWMEAGYPVEGGQES